jgi:hypothetical protein
VLRPQRPPPPAGCLIQADATGGVPTGAKVAPGHATGVFSPGIPLMYCANSSNNDRNDASRSDGHRHDDPCSADPAERFRKLLAEVIARQIVADRQRQANPPKEEPQ